MVWWISRFSERRGGVSGSVPGSQERDQVGALLTVSLRLSMADKDNKTRLCHDLVSSLLCRCLKPEAGC